MNIPPQFAFLYKGDWSSACDDIFVDCLITLKGETHWTTSFFPSWFLLTAAQEIKNTLGVIFGEVALSDRVEVLRVRFQTFKAVLRQHGARWDMPEKAVVAPDEVWVKILKINPFAGAYYYHEEPIFSKLACLFGMDDVKVEGATEVVVISDNTEELPGNEFIASDLDKNEEEVNSPAVFPTRTVRRKLFDEDHEAVDRESTTEMGIFFIDIAADGQLRTRVEKGRDLPKPPLVGPSVGGAHTRSPHASSCGSNSPMGCWPHLHK